MSHAGGARALRAPRREDDENEDGEDDDEADTFTQPGDELGAIQAWDSFREDGTVSNELLHVGVPSTHRERVWLQLAGAGGHMPQAASEECTRLLRRAKARDDERIGIGCQ